MEVTITVVICIAVVLIVSIISFFSYKACYNDAVRSRDRVADQSGAHAAERLVRYQEDELKRLTALLEKLLEKSPTISIKKE